jgi:hypothetical protein
VREKDGARGSREEAAEEGGKKLMYKSWVGVPRKAEEKRKGHCRQKGVGELGAAMSFERIKGSQEEKVMGGWLCMDGRPFSAISEDK